ncbi:MAG: SDR family NAD(P)-dependent oxidoreductase [Bacteroidota bacterium]
MSTPAPLDRTPAPEADVPNRRTALVTGSNGGVGLALAEKLHADGWRVLLHGRNAAKLARAQTRLGGAEAVQADLADLSAVRRLGDEVAAATDRLDALVHNAGLLRPELTRTEAGVETTMAVNVLAPFVLTNALRPLLEATVQAHGDARVVTVSSEAHRGGRFDTTDPEALAASLRGPTEPSRYSSIKAYAQSKLAATSWTLELARRLDGTGVTAHACHPGVVRTGVFGGVGGVVGFLAQAASVLYLSPSAGAASPYLLATDPAYGERTGRWVTRGHLRGPHEAEPPAQARAPEVGAAVWEALDRLAVSGT